MSESTTDIRIVPLPDGPGRPHRDPPGRGPADARPGHRGRGRRLDRRPRPPQGRRRPPAGRPQRPPPRADHPDRHRRRSRSSSPGSTTAGPPEQRETFTPAVLPPYLRRTKSLEELIPWLYLKGVSTGDFSEALQAILGPDAPEPVGDDRHPAQGRLGAGARGLEQAVAGGQALRLRLGRRRALQHPPGGGPAVHPGADGGDRRRQEGADRHRRRLPGERAVVEGAAAGRARPVAWRSSRAWRSATGRWGSGRRCVRCGTRRRSSGAGCTRRPTCWTSCPRASQPKAKGMLHEIYDGRDQGGGREGVRPVRGDVRGEVPQGDGVPGRRIGMCC